MIRSNIIKALSLFVAKKDDTRAYLRCINVELQADRTILTATDGVTLLSICVPGENVVPGVCNIPPSAFLKGDWYVVEMDEAGKVIVRNSDYTTEVPQDGQKFPNFRRVIPARPSDDRQRQYDAELLVRFKKASKLLGGIEYPIVRTNNFVDISLEHVVGIVMPLDDGKAYAKAAHGEGVSPSWLHKEANV